MGLFGDRFSINTQTGEYHEIETYSGIFVQLQTLQQLLNFCTPPLQYTDLVDA